MENLFRKLDLISLRLFIAVCQERNISRAAEREFITPSAVSRRISDIEKIVGLPLIHRHGRGITVTPAGDAVFRNALAIAGSIQKLSDELSCFHSVTEGSVRIVANLSSIVQFLPEDIAAFRQLFPNVNIELEEQNSAQAMRTLADRGADFAICSEINGLKQFESRPYRTDQLFVMLPYQHRLATCTSLKLQDLLAENLIGLKNDTALMQLLEREYTAVGATLSSDIRAGGLEAMCRMVHAGLGFAIVPKLIGELYTNTLKVTLRPLTAPWAARQSFLISHGREQLSATAGALFNFLKQK